MRNKRMDVMMALGIIFVVMGHNYQPNIFLIPAYTFQVSLFFFVSGYFFKTQEGFKDKWLWIKKKIKKLLVPYFIYNAFYALLTSYLLYRGVMLGDRLTLYSFLVRPFVDGHQYFLFLAAWFVPQLFLIHLFAQLLIFKEAKRFIFILLIASLVLSGLFISRYSPDQGTIQLILGRTAFGLSFYLFGRLLNIFGEKINRYLFSPECFFIFFVIYVSLGSFFGKFNYSMVFADFSNSPLVTISGTALAILLVYIISEFISRSISENNILIKIGQNTFSIMANHLLVFFLINYIFYKFSLIPVSALSNIFFHYQVEKIWFVYLFFGIGFPLAFSLLTNRLRKKYLVSKSPM